MGVNIELESASAAGRIIDAYNVASDAWSFPQSGDFWDAVHEAHQRGIRGAGCRIAIIDTACDLTIPRLAHQSGGQPIMPCPKGEPTEHGTAVALLVATVAPKAQLDIYEITRNGRPDALEIRKALHLIAQSNADIICMSLGLSQACDLTAIQDWVNALSQQGGLEQIIDKMIAEGGMPKPMIPNCRSPVCLCEEVNKASKVGKLVVAAVGNAVGDPFCPACATGALAIGFQLDQREVVAEAWEAAWATDPSYKQSGFVDFTIMQPPNVVGSSFAAPLFAGALALGIERSDLRNLMLSSKIGSLGDYFMGDWYRDVAPKDKPEEESTIALLYHKAIKTNPHFPDMSADTIFGASLFTSRFMINAGLFHMLARDLDDAERILSWCRQAAPKNCHAAANLGKTLFLMAQTKASKHPDRAFKLGERAQQEYSTAIRLRPEFRPYEAERRTIDTFLTTLR